MKQFADKIKEYRAQNGLTQEQLAEKLFVSRQAVSKWEQGRGYPSMPVLESISKLLNVTIDELIRSEEDEKLVLETNVSFGWRLKNHLVKKILLLLAPSLLCLIYMWIYAGVIPANYTLNSFKNLQVYQAYIQTVANYQSSAYFIMLIALIPAVLNIILYTLTVAGILKPRTFKIVFLILNAGILIVALISALIVSVQEGVIGLTSGLTGGCLMLLLSAGGVVTFFFLEASKAEKEIRDTSQIRKNIIKKLPIFLIHAAFYIFYMAIFLTSLFFSGASGVRHNLLTTYGQMALIVGLLIITPALITACLYLLVLMKKMFLRAFLSLMLVINLPTLIIALILAMLSMAPAGGFATGVWFAVGAFSTSVIYIAVLMHCIRSLRRDFLLKT